MTKIRKLSKRFRRKDTLSDLTAAFDIFPCSCIVLTIVPAIHLHRFHVGVQHAGSATLVQVLGRMAMFRKVGTEVLNRNASAVKQLTPCVVAAR